MEIFGFAAGPFQTNCYVVTGSSDDGDSAADCVIIDPGMGALDVVCAEVERRGWRPRVVLLTHGHIDHIRDAAAAARHWDIPVFIHEGDNALLSNPELSGYDFGHLFNVSAMQAYTEAHLLQDGDEISWAGVSFTVIHAPGHSPGCVMFRASDGADELVFTGDVLFKGAIGRVDLPGGNPQQMQRSLREKVMPLEDDLMILPGHGPASSIGVERSANPFLLELAHSA